MQLYTVGAIKELKYGECYPLKVLYVNRNRADGHRIGRVAWEDEEGNITILQNMPVVRDKYCLSYGMCRVDIDKGEWTWEQNII